MLISNGSITRNIAKHQLAEYEARGYKEVTSHENALESMKFDELKELAASLDIDVSKIKSKAAAIEAIEEAKKGGEE